MNLFRAIIDRYRTPRRTTIWEQPWYIKVFALAVVIGMTYVVARYL